MPSQNNYSSAAWQKQGSSFGRTQAFVVFDGVTNVVRLVIYFGCSLKSSIL